MPMAQVSLSGHCWTGGQGRSGWGAPAFGNVPDYIGGSEPERDLVLPAEPCPQGSNAGR